MILGNVYHQLHELIFLMHIKEKHCFGGVYAHFLISLQLKHRRAGAVTSKNTPDYC